MLYTIRQVQERTGLSDKAIRASIKQGTIHAERDGLKYLIPEEELSKLPNPRNTEHRPLHPQGKEREVAQDDFFTQLAQAMRKTPPGWEVTYKAPSSVA